MSNLAELRSRVRDWLRFRWLEPLRYHADVAGRVLTRRAAPVHRVLLIGDRSVYTSEQQFTALLAHRAALRSQLGVALHYQRLGDALARGDRFWLGFDLIGLKLGFRTSAAEAARTVRALRAKLAPHARLVYFDGDDDLGVLWPELLPDLDLYAKKHCFRDRSEYGKRRIGKTNLTDYVARTFGTSFADDIIPTSEAVAADQIYKIVPSWNLALDDKIRDLHAAHPAVPPAASKDIAVVCRASAARDSWIYPLRGAVIPEIRKLEPEHRVLTPEERVSQDVYYQEMLRSRICVSPFGYGEICWRDFEAILCGCVLVKPDMSHVETEPDIFVPDVTYVPVRWDYADLTATLSELLAQPERCERLRTCARDALARYLERDGIVASFGRILRGVGLDGARGRPAA
jgi:hypothetical protein